MLLLLEQHQHHQFLGVKNFKSVNADGGSNYVAYCFASKQGYSKFGKYVGNGSNTNGTFVYTGFKPAFIIAKRTDEAAHNWFMWDTKRSPFNLVSGCALSQCNKFRKYSF
jgi:hypothetical protein